MELKLNRVKFITYLLILFVSQTASARAYHWFQSGACHPGDTPYNGLYREALPETDTFFMLQVYKRVGKSII